MRCKFGGKIPNFSHENIWWVTKKVLNFALEMRNDLAGGKRGQPVGLGKGEYREAKWGRL